MAAPPGDATLTPATGETDVSQQILQDVLKEQAYQDLNDKLRSLQEELIKERTEKESAVKEKEQLAQTTEQLQNANNQAQSSLATSVSEVKSYKARMEMLNNEKKELEQDLAVSKTKSKNDDDWIRQLREQVESDSRQIRQLDAERIQANYDKEKFEHDLNIRKAALETAKSESKMYSDALIAKDAEFAAYRTSHYAELQKVTLELDNLNVEISNLRASKAEVQRQYEARTAALESSEREKADLRDKVDRQTRAFRQESSRLQAAINQLEVNAAGDRESVEEFERALRKSDEKHLQDEERLRASVAAAEKAKEEAERKMQDMAEVIERFSVAGINGNGASLSATADLLAGVQKSGRTYAEVYTDYATTQVQLLKANQEVERMKKCLEDVLMEMSIKAPELKQQRLDWEQMKIESEGLVIQLKAATEARDNAELAFNRLQSQQTASKDETQALKSQVGDLTLQVRNLAREIAVRDDPSLAYEAFDPLDAAANADVSDIDMVITSNLTVFRKLPELVEQNKKLLRISRELGRKLESKAAASAPPKPMSGFSADDDEAMAEAEELVLALRDEVHRLKQDLQDVKAQSDIFVKERDMFSRMLVQSRVSGPSFVGMPTGSAGAEDAVANVMDTLQKQFDAHRDSFNQQIQALEARLKEQAQSLQTESDRLTTALRSLAYEQTQNQLLRDGQSSDQTKMQGQQASLAQKEAAVTMLQLDMQKISEARNAAETEVARLRARLNEMQGESHVWRQNEDKQRAEIATMVEERAKLRRELDTKDAVRGQELETLKSRRAELELTNSQLRTELLESRSKLQKEIAEHAKSKDAALHNPLEEVLATAQKQITDLQAEIAAAGAAHDAAISVKDASHTAAIQELEKQVTSSKDEAARFREIGLKYQRGKAAADQKAAAKEAELNKSLEDVNASLETVKAELETAKAEAATLQTRVTELTAQIAQLQSAPASAPAATAQPLEVADLEAKVAKLESELAASQAAAAAAAAAVPAAVPESTTDAAASAAAAAELQKVTQSLADAQALLSTSQEELTKVKTDAEAQAAASKKELEDLNNRLTELSSRPVLDADAQLPAGSISDEAVAAELTKARQDLAALQTEYEQYKTTQTERYDTSVTKVNVVNGKLKAAKDAADSRAAEAIKSKEAAVKEAVDQALSKQQAELEAAHSAALEKAKKEAEESLAKAQSTSAAVATQAEPNEEIAKLQAQLETTRKDLGEQRERASRAALVQSQLSRSKTALEQSKAENEKLKKELEALKQGGGGAASAGTGAAGGPAQMSIAGAAGVSVNPQNRSPNPNNGTGAGRGGGTAVRGRGRGRGGPAGTPQARPAPAAAASGARDPASILAAAGYPQGAAPNQGQGLKRPASQTEVAQSDPKRAKTDGQQHPSPADRPPPS